MSENSEFLILISCVQNHSKREQNIKIKQKDVNVTLKGPTI